MQRQCVTFAFLLVLLLTYRFTYANTLEIAPALYIFKYQEFDQNDQLLDKEEGVMPGVRLAYGNLTKNDSLRLDAAFYGGRVDYTGQTQSGTPHQTDTDEQLVKLGISYLQHEVTLFRGLLFAGLHYWYWDRDILARNGVQGLHERYTWYETELGLKFTSESSYWLELSAMYNFRPRMVLFLPSSEVRFNLQSRPGYRVRAGKTWDNRQDITTTLSLFAEYWEFGRSNTVFTNDFFGSSGFLTEPDSKTFNSGLEFSFVFNF